jgi:hypothetical protein
MSKVYQRFGYWRENFKIAKEKHDTISWAITIVFLVAGAILRSLNLASPLLASISDETLGRVCIWIGIAVGFWSFLWLPVRRHEIEERNHQEKMVELESRFGEQKRELELQIQKLQVQLDDKVRRKKIKDELGSCRLTIQNLCGQLRGVPYFKYYGETRQKFEQDYLDTENTTYRFLNDKVGRSEALSFIDDERVPKVVLPQDAHFDMDEFRNRWIQHEFMLNRLKYRAEQLEKTEEKLDSKDFILPFESVNQLR